MTGSRAATEQDGQAPSGPTELPKHHWKGVLVRTIREFKDDNLMDWAAALTYYGVLSLFPGLIVMVALLGVFGQYPETFEAMLDIVRQLAPASAVDTLAGPIEGVIRQKQAAGALLGFGLAGAIWSASGYIGAFMRAMNIVYEVEEGRPFWKLRPLQIVLTILMVLLLSGMAVAIVITGPVAHAIGNVIGLGDQAVTAWNYAKWPVLLGIVMLVLAVLYWVGPNVRHPRFRWVSPGGILAVLLWVAASAGFALYVANFDSYSKTYGTLGGAITFLVWLWISNIAILLGGEFDAELERARELEGGMPAEEELQLPPKDPVRE